MDMGRLQTSSLILAGRSFGGLVRHVFDANLLAVIVAISRVSVTVPYTVFAFVMAGCVVLAILLGASVLVGCIVSAIGLGASVLVAFMLVASILVASVLGALVFFAIVVVTAAYVASSLVSTGIRCSIDWVGSAFRVVLQTIST